MIFTVHIILTRLNKRYSQEMRSPKNAPSPTPKRFMSALREITGGNGPERDEKFRY